MSWQAEAVTRQKELGNLNREEWHWWDSNSQHTATLNMLHPQPWLSVNGGQAVCKALVYIRAAKCEQWLTPPTCSKNTWNQGLGLKRLQTGPVRVIHFPVRLGLKWNNEIHFKVEQICTGGGNILKVSKRLSPSRNVRGNGSSEWCVRMWVYGEQQWGINRGRQFT